MTFAIKKDGIESVIFTVSLDTITTKIMMDHPPVDLEEFDREQARIRDIFKASHCSSNYVEVLHDKYSEFTRLPEGCHDRYRRDQRHHQVTQCGKIESLIRRVPYVKTHHVPELDVPVPSVNAQKRHVHDIRRGGRTGLFPCADIKAAENQPWNYYRRSDRAR